MPVLFLIIFVNVLGFGLIIPLLPFYVERLGGSPEVVTLIVALYSLLQFLTAPLIGRLSDTFGRRPVLAWTTLGTVLAHLLLGVADSLWLVILARSLGGVMAGNLGVAYAYAADITTHENRARAMGILSAAFSLGFMFGPGIGGLLAGSDVETANFMLPAFSAAALTVIAWFGILFFLPESVRPEDRRGHQDSPKVSLAEQIRVTFKSRLLASMAVISFLLYMAWTLFLAIFALWANRVLDHGPAEIGFLFMYSGLVGAVSQFTLIGPLAKRIGEINVVLATVIAMIAGLLLMAVAATPFVTLVAMTLLSAAHSIFTPIVTTVASKKSSPRDRGVILGVFQSIGGLGRVAGPLFSGAAFAQLGYSSPFQIGAAVMVPCVVITIIAARRQNRIDSSSRHQN
jgi:DHA1 family tetracycline resistance protein-like MFS transporter